MEKTVDFEALLETFEDNYEEELEESTQETKIENESSEPEEETEEKEDVVDTTESEETEETEETSEEGENAAQENDFVKLSKNDHSKLVEKNQKLDAYLKSEHDFLRKLAETAGYATVKDFKEAAMKQVNKKKAEAQGIPVETLEKLQEQELRISQMERANAEIQFKNRQKAVISSIKTTFDEFEVPENQRGDILNDMEARGIDLKVLMSIPDPSLLIKGALSNVTIQKKAEKIVKNQNKINNLDTETHSKESKEIDSEFEDFDDYMAEYAESSGLEYKKRGK